MSLAALEAVNPQITDPSRIFPGQMICIPGAFPPLRTCCFVLAPREAGGVDAGGVVWLRHRGDGDVELLIAGYGLPAPSTLGAETHTAVVSWERTSFDVPMEEVPGVEGLWVAVTANSLPPAFFRFGIVDILPGPGERWKTAGQADWHAPDGRDSGRPVQGTRALR